MGRPQNTVERMLVVNVDQSTECWLWTGSISSNGYAKAAMKRAMVLPHRVFYEHFKGVIPQGIQIDHLCKVRHCVNPIHLEAVTAAENNRRSTSPSALNGRKANCHRGHALTGPNLYTTPDGRRQCKACQPIRQERASA